jgi:hypothetical protein
MAASSNGPVRAPAHNRVPKKNEAMLSTGAIQAIEATMAAEIVGEVRAKILHRG